MSAVFIIVRWSIVVNYGSVFASIFIKDGSLYPMLKETIKAAFKLLSFFLSIWRIGTTLILATTQIL